MSNEKIENLDIGLFIGIENYQNQAFIPDPAAGARENAIQMEELVRAICDETHSRLKFTTMLSGDDVMPPTFANIRQELKSLKDESPPLGGRLFFYFCGHGAISAARKDLLLPEDADEGGSAFEVGDLLKYFSCRPFEQVILMIDACRDLPGDRNLNIYEMASSNEKDLCHRTLVLQATRSGEKAWADQDLEAGIFTSSVLEVYNYDPDLRRYRLPDKYLRYLESVPALHARCLLPKTLGNIVDALIKHKLENKAYQTPDFLDKTGINPTIALARVDDPNAGQLNLGLEFERFFAARLSHIGFENLVQDLWDDLDQAATDVAILYPDENAGQQPNGQLPPEVAMWLVEQVLLRRRRQDGSFRKIHLNAPGMSLQEIDLEEQQAIRDSESRPVFYGLFLDSAVTSEALSEFMADKWQPFMAQYQAAKKRFEASGKEIIHDGQKFTLFNKMQPLVLIAIAESRSLEAVFQQAVHNRPFTSIAIPAFGTEDLINWIARFRHDLPLKMVHEREATARQIADPPIRFDRAIIDLIETLKSDTRPWEEDILN